MSLLRSQAAAATWSRDGAGPLDATATSASITPLLMTSFHSGDQFEEGRVVTLLALEAPSRWRDSLEEGVEESSRIREVIRGRRKLSITLS